MISSQPKAVIYRGPAVIDGCPEAIATLLRSSPYNFRIVYAGPKEAVDITVDTLSDAAVYCQPGGDDLETSYPHMKPYRRIIKNYILRGGRYIGICLGAYLAGTSPGLGLLPRGIDTDIQIEQKYSQIKSEDDGLIQVDWTFCDGRREKGRWLYFQDGAVIKVPRAMEGKVKVLGRYSQSKGVAACVTRLGEGWVGVCGPHPEAVDGWYDEFDLTNPDGIRLDIGYDFVEAVMKAE